MDNQTDAAKIKLLEMLKWFHKLCIQENLRYYAVGGTLLGAVRHGGFIPWDDDIDIAMPRNDYERLRSISPKLSTSEYRFEFPGESWDFVYAYGKLFDTSTTLIENRRHKPKRGLFMDVFPLDGLGDTEKDALTNFSSIDSDIKLFETRMCAVRKGRKIYKNIAVLLMRCVPEFILNTKKLSMRIESKCRAHDFDCSEYVANCLGNWHEREIALRSSFGTPKLCKFEDTEIFCPEDPDKYLTGVYGDWRKLPPPEKRVSHHDFIKLDINTPYTDKK